MPIDGLVVHNASVLPAVLQGLAEAGVAPGRDVAIATFDDPPELQYLAGGVTSEHEPVAAIAR